MHIKLLLKSAQWYYGKATVKPSKYYNYEHWKFIT